MGLGEAGGADWGRGRQRDTVMFFKKILLQLVNLGIILSGFNENGNSFTLLPGMYR